MSEQRNSGTNGAQRGAFSTQFAKKSAPSEARQLEALVASEEVFLAAARSVQHQSVNQPMMAYSAPVSRAPAFCEAFGDESRLQRARRSLQSASEVPPSKADLVADAVGKFVDVDREVAVSRRMLHGSRTNEVPSDSRTSASYQGHPQLATPGSQSPSSRDVDEFESEVAEFLQLPPPSQRTGGSQSRPPKQSRSKTDAQGPEFSQSSVSRSEAQSMREVSSSAGRDRQTVPRHSSRPKVPAEFNSPPKVQRYGVPMDMYTGVQQPSRAQRPLPLTLERYLMQDLGAAGPP